MAPLRTSARTNNSPSGGVRTRAAQAAAQPPGTASNTATSTSTTPIPGATGSNHSDFDTSNLFQFRVTADPAHLRFVPDHGQVEAAKVTARSQLDSGRARTAQQVVHNLRAPTTTRPRPTPWSRWRKMSSNQGGPPGAGPGFRAGGNAAGDCLGPGAPQTGLRRGWRSLRRRTDTTWPRRNSIRPWVSTAPSTMKWRCRRSRQWRRRQEYGRASGPGDKSASDLQALARPDQAQEYTIGATRGAYYPALGATMSLSDSGQALDNLAWNWYRDAAN